MIFLTQVVNWTTKRPEKYLNLAWGNYVFLNTNRIVELIVFDGTGSQFKYCQAPDDHRCSPDTIETNTSVADIEIWHNIETPSKFATLPIFPTNDITRVLIDTPVNTLVAFDDICMGYATARDIALNVMHCVYYRESFKRVTCIINMSFAEVQSALSNVTPLLDYDHNVYSTVRIGTQEWIVGNLRTTHYADGTAIPNVVDNALWQTDVTGDYCWYNNDIVNRDTYGALYNWYAVTNAHQLVVGQFTVGGIVSVGWRAPSVADWAALSNAAGGWALAGGRLKEVGLAHWLAPNPATNDYGFRAMGNGNRFVDSNMGDGFASLGIFNDSWTTDSDPLDPTSAYSVYMYNASTQFNNWGFEKFGGMAVRAVRDI